jgi:hypothetical protein
MILNYIISILKELSNIHLLKASSDYETIFLKLGATIKLTLLISPIAFISNALMHWTEQNMSFILFVLGAIIADHALGTWKHLKIDKDFTIKQNIKGLFLKLAMVIVGAYLFEGINHIIVKDSVLKDYLMIVMRLIVFLYPAGSAFGNMSVFTNGKFPPKKWIDRLNSFQENLNPNDLGGKKENQ